MLKQIRQILELAHCYKVVDNYRKHKALYGAFKNSPWWHAWKEKNREKKLNNYAKKHKKLFQKHCAGKDFIGLNLGCGNILLEGWLNIDLWHYGNYTKDIVEKGKSVVGYDLTAPIPMEDESVDFIFHSHLLEHLTYEKV